MEVTADVADVDAAVATDWGNARLDVSRMRGDLELPIVLLPWWLAGVLSLPPG